MIIFILAIICLSSCSNEDLILNMYSNIDNEKLPIEFETFDEAWQFVDYKIYYKKDKNDSWQTPIQTYKRRTGDCEDMAILLAYFCNELDIPCTIIKIKIGTCIHMLLKVENYYIEPGRIYTYYDKDNIKIIDKYTYFEALKLAYYQ